MGVGSAPPSRPCFVNTNRRSMSWHSEHVKVWCSKPEIPMVSSWATLTRIIPPPHAIQRIARTPTNLTRTTSAHPSLAVIQQPGDAEVAFYGLLTVALTRASYGRAALRSPAPCVLND